MQSNFPVIGLFQKAASASGTALTPWSLEPFVLKNSIKLASMLRCPTNDVRLMMRCLKIKPVEEILEASNHITVPNIISVPSPTACL